MQLPIEDKHSYSRESLLARIAVLMGGRAAEHLIFDTFTTGAGNDIERATDMARKMVCEWGMSDKMGPLSFGKKDESIFLGREMAMHKNFSEKIAEHIDDEIKRIVDEAYERALGLLRDNVENLHNLSVILIEKENLTGDQVDEIITTGTLVTPEPVVPPTPPTEPPPPSTDIIA
jgi:cell division protease FtsH